MHKNTEDDGFNYVMDFGNVTLNAENLSLARKLDKEIDMIVKQLDHDGNGTIEYSEFLAETLSEKCLDKYSVRLFFNQFQNVGKDPNQRFLQDLNDLDMDKLDDDEKLTISIPELQGFFRKCGRVIGIKQIGLLIKEAGKICKIRELDGESDISFKAFYKFMCKLFVNKETEDNQDYET